MKTRDKILLAGLDAFSEQGVAQISTNHIADILEISPGNLYYHFKSKQAIIEELYRCFSIDFSGFMNANNRRIDTPQEMWLVLSLSFKLLVKYRFVFRDSSFTNSKYPELKKAFSSVVQNTRHGVDVFCHQLIASGMLNAHERELKYLSTSLHQGFTQWIGYVDICRHGGEEKRLSAARASKGADPFYIAQGVVQMVHLLLPYMELKTQASFAGIEENTDNF